MEQIIKINVPEGKVAVYDENAQTIKFVDKEPIRSKSWEEFCENHPDARGEYYITKFGDIDSPTCHDEYGEFRTGNAYLAKKEDAEGIIALIQLIRLHDEWVGDWKPDYSSSRFNAHSIHRYNGELNFCVLQENINSILTFPTFEMALEFSCNFRDLLNKAKKFI